MNDFKDITTGKELIVRKRLASFLEKLLRYLGYEFRHDTYKKIIYQEEGFETPLEEMIKNYYDAYYYLLSNHKNPFTKEFLNKFFYILDGKKVEQSMLLRLVTRYFDYIDLPGFEAAIKFHLKAYEEMLELDLEKRMIVSLMLFNYCLLKKDIPTMHILQTDLKRYENARNMYLAGNKIPIYDFFVELISKSKFQNKSYYKNLKPLTIKEIYTELIKDKEMLINVFKIKSISIFGSFAKSNQRIDSDIDLLIAFSLDLTYGEKKSYIEYLSKYYFNIFHRYIDITEISEYLNDEFIKELTNIKKIY